MDHAVELGHAEIGIADHRIVHLGAGDILDVVLPAFVVIDRVDRNAQKLDAALVELILDLGHVAKLGRADRREVFGMGEKHHPCVVYIVMELDAAFSAVGLEIGSDVAKLQSHSVLHCLCRRL
jgi:hypothetical protein